MNINNPINNNFVYKPEKQESATSSTPPITSPPPQIPLPSTEDLASLKRTTEKAQEMVKSAAESLKENKDPNKVAKETKEENKTVKPKKILHETEETEKTEGAPETTKTAADKAKSSAPSLDTQYICGDTIFYEHAQLIKNLGKMSEGFNLHAFVQGKMGHETASGSIIIGNTNILNRLTEVYKITAKQMIANGQAKDLDAAYKILVGILDRHDQLAIEQYKNERIPVESTYVLRTALLHASHQDGAGLETWMVYTKAGKPDKNNLWPFLENPKNWIPEVQRIRTKWKESTLVKAKALSQEHTTEAAVFVKGGYGAGKTRFITQHYGEHASNAIAPDKAKDIDRRANPVIPHFAAHKHGSQAAFEIMNELVKTQPGTLIYDSSLSDPNDIKKYLADCKAARKKMIVQDIARNDMARILAVLVRSIDGEDPRIPPELIVESAIKDKMKRVDCMNVVLNDNTQDPAIKPEYHFTAGDEHGWNSQEVMVLGPNGKIELMPGAEKRLGLEGIGINADEKGLHVTLSEAELSRYYQAQLEKPVSEIRKSLSAEEQMAFNVFGTRSFHIKQASGPINNATALYLSLPSSVRNAIPQKSFESAFEAVGPEVRDRFFQSIQSKKRFTYNELPLRTALIIHQNLKTDPWKAG